MILFGLVPMAVVAIAFYFVISGLRESVKPVRLAIGYGIMLAVVIAAGVASALSNDLGLIVFLLGLFVAVASFVGAVYCLVLLNGWRRVHAVSGLLFPVMLYGGIMLGWQFAPEPLTLEEQYIQAAEDFLNEVQRPDGTPNDGAMGSQDCIPYLREHLSEYDGQYSLDLQGPSRDSAPAGSMDAAVVVEFPDGGRVRLYFYNTWLEGCHVLEDDA